VWALGIGLKPLLTCIKNQCLNFFGSKTNFHERTLEGWRTYFYWRHGLSANCCREQGKFPMYFPKGS
jgi:hypothetical protein